MSNQSKKLAFNKKSSSVVLKNVTKIFQQPDTGKDFVAVDSINLEIQDIPLSEIMDCIDKIVVDGGGKIVVKWSCP